MKTFSLELRGQRVRVATLGPEAAPRAGDYVRYEAGSVHAPVALGRQDAPTSDENPACVLFASARAGITLV